MEIHTAQNSSKQYWESINQHGSTCKHETYSKKSQNGDRIEVISMGIELNLDFQNMWNQFLLELEEAIFP